MTKQRSVLGQDNITGVQGCIAQMLFPGNQAVIARSPLIPKVYDILGAVSILANNSICYFSSAPLNGK